MSEVSFDDMMPLITPFAPGCPTVVIEMHLAESAAKFCDKAKIWRIDIDVDTTTAGEPDYEVDLPSNTKLADVLFFKVDGRLMTRVTDRLQEPSDDQAAPNSFAIYNDNLIRLYPTPDAAYSFKGTAVIKPSVRAKGIDDFLFETHRRVIAYGALAELLMIPGKDWSDASLATFYENKFNDGVIEATARDSRKVKKRNKSYFF